ncbi:MAG TPA: hypothetical protein VIS77_13865 [Burkholderiales bacterium]
MHRLILLAISLLLALPVAAQDATRGKRLYELHCGGCHYEKLHERPHERSRVKSLSQLRTEVAERAKGVTQRFALEDLDDIAEYLNQTHYRFGR